MTIKRSAILIVLVVSLASCSNRQNGEVSVKEDLTAKQLLQGIWVNDETEMPLMRIEGGYGILCQPAKRSRTFQGCSRYNLHIQQ